MTADEKNDGFVEYRLKILGELSRFDKCIKENADTIKQLDIRLSVLTLKVTMISLFGASIFSVIINLLLKYFKME